MPIQYETEVAMLHTRGNGLLKKWFQDNSGPKRVKGDPERT